MGPVIPSTRRPWLSGCRPSTYLSGSISSRAPRSQSAAGGGVGRHGVHLVGDVEGADRCQQVGLGSGVWKVLVRGVDGDLGGSLLLPTHVARARRVVTDEDGAESRSVACTSERVDSPAVAASATAVRTG